MRKRNLLAGVAGLSILMSGVTARAQGASGQAAQAGAAPTQPAVRDCSGLGCLFGSRAQPQPVPQAQNAPPPGAADPAGAPAPAKPAVRRAARPVHVVTIAADSAEVAQMQRLASALPKEKIKIVRTGAGADRSKSDFSITTSLQAAPSAKTTKLFTEQMHIVAGETIRSVSDLQGRVVSFGPDKSPGQAAARKAFEALNIAVKETPLDLDNALDGLATGDVDAVVVIAPQPIDRLGKVRGAHLVSWPEGGSLPAGASAATIDAAAYPALAKPGETIRAMGVDATLTISAKGEKTGAAKTFLRALAQHSDALTKKGFDLLKANLEIRTGRRVASADRS